MPPACGAPVHCRSGDARRSQGKDGCKCDGLVQASQRCGLCVQTGGSRKPSARPPSSTATGPAQPSRGAPVLGEVHRRKELDLPRQIWQDVGVRFEPPELKGSGEAMQELQPFSSALRVLDLLDDARERLGEGGMVTKIAVVHKIENAVKFVHLVFDRSARQRHSGVPNHIANFLYRLRYLCTMVLYALRFINDHTRE